MCGFGNKRKIDQEKENLLIICLNYQISPYAEIEIFPYSTHPQKVLLAI